MKNWIIVDIDGTIANSAWREHLISESWDVFHAAAKDDKPYPAMAALLMLLNRQVNILCITGRTEKWRELTTYWLMANDIPIDELLMRPENDFRPAPVLKTELAKAFFEGKMDQLLLAIDDRDDVIAAFRALGIATMTFGA